MDAALHEWSLSPKQAIALQSQLAQQLESRDRINPVTYIAGVDIGFEESGAVTRAAVVVLQWLPEEAPYLPVVEQVVHREPTRMPYIPGLLSFREIPAALGAFAKLKTQPQLVMVDGQGIAHPRLLEQFSLLVGISLNRGCEGFEQYLSGLLLGEPCTLSEQGHSNLPRD